MKDSTRALSLIGSGASLWEISKCFDSTIDAYAFYGNVMQKRHVMDSKLAQCPLCSSNADVVQQLSWRAITHDKSTGLYALAMLLFGRITARCVEVKFSTHHSMCPKCARRTWWRIIFSEFLRNALFALLILDLCLFVPMLVVTGSMIFLAPDLTPQFLGFSSIGAVFLFVIVMGFKWLWSFSAPGSLREIGRYPFELVSIKRFEPDRSI